MRTGACIPRSGGICHEGSEGEITELEKSPLDSSVSSTSWDAPRGMAWAAGLVPPGDPACACHRSPRRWNHKRPRFSLGGPHGVGPLPWPASWHRLSPLGRSMSSALLGCHGTLRRRRNLPSKRLPWPVSRQKMSPLGGSAPAASCQLPAASCLPSTARRRIHQIEMQTSTRKTPSCAIVTRVFFRTF